MRSNANVSFYGGRLWHSCLRAFKELFQPRIDTDETRIWRQRDVSHPYKFVFICGYFSVAEQMNRVSSVIFKFEV